MFRKNLPMSAPLNTDAKAGSERDFLRIASWSTALGFACMAAAVASLRAGADGYYFTITPATALAFAGGGLAGWAGWRAAGRGRLAGRLGFAVLAAAGVAAFFYPLRFAPRERLAEIAIGMTVALVVVGTGGLLIWQVIKGLSADERRGGEGKN